MEEKKVSLKSAVMYSVITGIVAIFLTATIAIIISNLTLAETNKRHKEELGVFSSIVDLYSYLPEEQRNYDMYLKLAEIDFYYRTYYVGAENIDENKLIYTLANGYIGALGDKHGEYYTADDFMLLMSQTQGNTVGVGVYVGLDADTQAIKVFKVMKGSPAETAGLKNGDIIVAVDGSRVASDGEVVGIGYIEAINRIAGKEGTEVKLTVLRNGAEIELTAIRSAVTTETVYYHQYELDSSVGVIRILEFNDSMPQQFKDAVDDLLENKGCTSLVFDMRGNPGGTLDSCIDVLDYLLPKGKAIVKVTDGQGNILEQYNSTSNHSVNVPMAVLTDGNTASAGELFTCALKDHGLARVVGTKTYGKGSMQSVLMLSDGSGLRFTTNLYNPPISENYDGVGITPDVYVEIDDSLADKNYFEYTDATDNQLKSACDLLTTNE